MENYTGMTAYVRNTPETTSRFRALGEEIFQLMPYLGTETENLSRYNAIINSDAAKLVRDNDAAFTKTEAFFPSQTPVEYQDVSISGLEINDQYFTRLHVPVIAENAQEIIENGLRPVLFALFGDDLVNIKIKSGTSADHFAELKEVVLVSAQRTQPND